MCGPLQSLRVISKAWTLFVEDLLGFEEDFDVDDLDDDDFESLAELSRMLDLCEVRRWSELVCRRLEPRAGKGRPGPT
jgi:hypothetical protein